MPKAKPKQPEQGLRIEYVALSAVKKFDRNPKKHDIGALVSSIRRYGFRDAPIFDGTLGALVAGHGRIAALEVMRKDGDGVPDGVREQGGAWFVPIQLGVDAKSATEAQAFLVDHNALTLSGGDLGVDSILRLYDQDGLAGILRDLASADAMPITMDGEDLDELLNGPKKVTEDDPSDLIDHADELRKKWSVETCQLWILGDHRLLCGDSTKAEDVARVMGGSRADCVFTSPPYGVGVDYGATYSDTIDNLRAMLPVLAEKWMEVVEPGGFAVVNFGDIVPGRDAAETEGVCEYPMAVEYWPSFRSAGWSLWSRRIWCKPNARVHSPWAIQSNRAASDWEHVWTWKAPGAPIVARVNGEHQSANGWFDTTREQGVGVGKGVHGAGMAVALPARMLDTHSRRGRVVFEPFTGTGTTLIAAEQLGRRCYGIEIAPQYVAVCLQRWADATGKTPELQP